MSLGEINANLQGIQTNLNRVVDDGISLISQKEPFASLPARYGRIGELTTELAAALTEVLSDTTQYADQLASFGEEGLLAELVVEATTAVAGTQSDDLRALPGIIRRAEVAPQLAQNVIRERATSLDKHVARLHTIGKAAVRMGTLIEQGSEQTVESLGMAKSRANAIIDGYTA